MSRWLPPRTDCLLAIVLLVVAEAELWSVDVGGARPLMSAGLAVGCLAVAFRRTAPLTATAVSLAGVMVVPGLADVDAATTLGWLVVALVMSASCGYHVVSPGIGLGMVLGLVAIAIVAQKGPVVSEVLFGWILAGGAWLGGRTVAVQAASARLAREHAALIEERTLMLAQAAVAEERLWIAREMHDVVAHSLSVMMLHVGGVRRLLRPDQESEREALTGAERTGREAISEMHRVLGVLRGRPDAESGPPPTLLRLEEVLAHTRQAGPEVVLEVTGQPRDLPPGPDVAAFRIVQEALTNVRRHAQASRVEVRLNYRPGGLEIKVRDDGRGPAADEPAGHGIVGMRERAAAYGGDVSVGPEPGGGCVVRAWLPAPDEVTGARDINARPGAWS